MLPSLDAAFDRYIKLSPEFIIFLFKKYYHFQQETLSPSPDLSTDTAFYTAFEAAPLLSETFKVMK